jgi:hypothetical protein
MNALEPDNVGEVGITAALDRRRGRHRPSHMLPAASGCENRPTACGLSSVYGSGDRESH